MALYLVLVSGSRERLQMAAMMASVAAVNGEPVTVFVSMNALPAFLASGAPVAPAEGPVGRLLVERKAPPFLQLFEQACELGGAEIYPCSMAVDLLALKEGQLPSYLKPPLGLTKFLSDAAAGQMVVV